MKNDVIELTKSEYDFLESIDLNLTRQEQIYFDYDFIIANIDQTPKEIVKMSDNIDRKTLSWFDRLFVESLKKFWGNDFEDIFANNVAHGNIKCPLNDKESEEYKDYIRYKKVFALSLKTMVEGKSQTFIDEYNNKKENITNSTNVDVKDYVAALSSSDDNFFAAPDKKYIDYETKVNLYSRVIADKRKPNITAGTSFKNIMDMLEKALKGEELTAEETNIEKYICKMIKEKSLQEALNPKNRMLVNNKIEIIFVIRALVDSTLNRDYSEQYLNVFSKKESINQDIDEVMLNAYKMNSEIGNAIREMDSYLSKMSVSNLYQEFSEYLFGTTEEYKFLKDANGVSPDIISEENRRYFKRKDSAESVFYNIVDGENITEVEKKLTTEEITEDGIEIGKKRNALEDDIVKQTLSHSLIDIITKMLAKQPLNPNEKALLKNNGIAENLSEEDLKDKKTKLEKEYQDLYDSALKRASDMATLIKANDILNYTPKKAKKKNPTPNSSDNAHEDNNDISPLKKWATKITKVACPIIGGAIGCNLAFVLSPMGIVAANVIGAFIITQARAYANILEEQELSSDEIEIESIEKPTNKVCNKVSGFLRKLHADKLANFNMFEKLANTRFEKVNNFFGNKEVLRTIANTVTAGLVAMDLNAFKRVISNKLATKQAQDETLTNKENGAGRTEPSGNESGNTTPGTEPGNTPGSTTPGNTEAPNGSGDTSNFTDPAVEPMRVGDSIGNDSQIINGYKNSYDAYNGVNGVHLNQSIINDGETIIKNLYYNNNGKMVKLSIQKGQDILETIEKLGLNPNDVVANLANADGTGRAWVHISDVARTLGRSI